MRLFYYVNVINCHFPGGGGPRPRPPLDPRMGTDFYEVNTRLY